MLAHILNCLNLLAAGQLRSSAVETRMLASPRLHQQLLQADMPTVLGTLQALHGGVKLTASFPCPVGALPPVDGARELVADLEGAVLCRLRPGSWSVLLPSAL
jgi:hypothetical protein